ncbi:hypothetical protein [Tardiphaga sp. 11_C7_N12_6]|uniref:hypothetical protein n=1 Tax=Tardiphaga sp. 11_C7_N12_6 TaxID=3240789 RepID=UPI003F21DB71
MNAALVEEIRRHLANALRSQTLDSFAYANAIGGAFKESTKEIQTVIRREAAALGIHCT